MSAARLENFSEEEKVKLLLVMKKRLAFSAAIYLSIVLVSVALVFFFNKFSGNYFFQDHLEIVNVVFVFIIVICIRMLVAEVMDHGKETKSPVKKVVQTKILGKKNDKITLGNKSFAEHEFIFGVNDFDSFKTGENVIIELSAKSDMLFTIKRI